MKQHIKETLPLILALAALVLGIISIIYTAVTAPEPERETRYPAQLDFDLDFKRDFPNETYQLYPAQNLTAELLEGRTEWDRYLVEICTGTLLNEAGDGTADLPAPYNYISYKKLNFDAAPGDRIVTYFVYSRDSGEPDDIIARYDYPLE